MGAVDELAGVTGVLGFCGYSVVVSCVFFSEVLLNNY